MEVGAGDDKIDKNDKLYDEKESACPDDATPDDMEVAAGDDKNDKNYKIYDEKEAACLDDTTPADMELGASDDKNDQNDKLYDKKEAACPDEETSEGETRDSVISTVNDAEGTDLTISVDIEEGVAKKRKIRMIE